METEFKRCGQGENTCNCKTEKECGYLGDKVKPLLQQAMFGGWHFLPETPEINKEVLVAVKHEDEPLQAFWTGKEWKGSILVRDNMVDGFVRDESYRHIQEWIFAWMELPKVPSIPEPF